jgi:hypothetical protein
MENNVIKWDDMGNSSIKMRLDELLIEQKSIVNKIVQLSEKLEYLEKEYYYGNKILTKRYKGED